MSKLDDLIEELCPNGVNYVQLNQFSKIYDGTHNTPQYTNYGVKFVSVENINDLYNTSKYISEEDYEKYKIKPRVGDVLMTRIGSIGVCSVIERDEPLAYYVSLALIRPDTSIIDSRFLKYAIESLKGRKELRKRTLVNAVPIKVNKEDIGKIVLPVPPLEVQREIVHILDSFTLLTAELTAELTARKKQYEFYRNTLLTFDNTVKIVPLADIADIGTGSSNTNEGLEEGKYPFYVRSQEPLRKNEYEYDETAIITAGDGVGVGKVFHYVEGKYALHQRAYRIHINTPDVLPRYYFHYMRSAFLPYIQKTMFQGSVASIRRPMLNQFPVPVPTLAVQKRLVNVLDNFETICNDLNIGLPAEIEARQKQYEYYRDLLLTFAETGSTLMTDRQTDRQTELSAIKLIQYVFGYAIVRLDYIADFRNGKGHEKSIVADGRYIVVNSKFISTDGQVRKYSDDQICPLYVNDILMVMSDLPNGRALAKCYLVDEDDKYTLNQRIGAFTVSRADLVTTKYLYYILSRNPQLLRYDNGADQTNLRKADILNISIAIPMVKEQKKITEILDHFNSLCNDLSTGLPAEIEARQKQYEYYRDKLLSFKELPK